MPEQESLCRGDLWIFPPFECKFMSWQCQIGGESLRIHYWVNVCFLPEKLSLFCQPVFPWWQKFLIPAPVNVIFLGGGPQFTQIFGQPIDLPILVRLVEKRTIAGLPVPILCSLCSGTQGLSSLGWSNQVFALTTLTLCTESWQVHGKCLLNENVQCTSATAMW